MQRSMNLPPECIACLQYKKSNQPFSSLRSSIILALSLIFFATPPNLIRAQTNLCGFDGSLQQLEIDYPEIIQIMNANEAAIQEMINNNHQAIMNHDVYIIPVVFHVIHLGEPVGLGSNISDAQIYQGLADLNNYFRDVPGLGNDVEIAFCLAQRDPAGNLSTGINRVNGYGVGNYQNIGIASGNNETTIKALSIWPNTEYLNIWVVHYIAGPSGTTTLGNAYFPGAPPAIDGITLRYDAVGEPGNSAVIAHEAGHFLSLYHTFQGGTTTSCPPSPNNNCQLDGDHVCDTPPHKLVYGGCNVTGTNDCDNNTSNALVIHNYMSYSDNSCLHEFTMGQVERMRSALITQRSSLITSLGCEPGCTTTVANFTVSPLEVPAGTTLQFDNASSSNADTFIWRINGLEITNNEDLNYTFTNGGVFEVCLDAFGPNCVNRRCTTITVYPTCVTPVETCEKVWNGDFEQITSSAPSGWGQGFKAVCYWKTTLSSPFFCNKPDNNSIGLFALPKDEEKNHLPIPPES